MLNKISILFLFFLSTVNAVEYGFTGQEKDDELHYFGARYYDSSIGRFIQPDPIIPSSDPQALNRYSYVYNNPINYVDPSGYTPEGVIIDPFLFDISDTITLDNINNNGNIENLDFDFLMNPDSTIINQGHVFTINEIFAIDPYIYTFEKIFDDSALNSIKIGFDDQYYYPDGEEDYFLGEILINRGVSTDQQLMAGFSGGGGPNSLGSKSMLPTLQPRIEYFNTMKPNIKQGEIRLIFIGNDVIAKRFFLGDTVQFLDGQVYLNSRKLIEPYLSFQYARTDGFKFGNSIHQIPKGHGIALSDNRVEGYDSRKFGFVPLNAAQIRVNPNVYPEIYNK
jgi:signal peptidase I